MTTTPVLGSTLDNLGVEFLTGDRVMVTAWGYGARLHEVRTIGVVEGVNRTRLRVQVGEATRSFGPQVLTVLRRDGEPGFEGNRR